MSDVESHKSKIEEEEEREEEEDFEEARYKDSKDAILFAIEVNKSMLTPPPADSKGEVEDSPLLASLKCAFELVTQRLITHPHDKTGILLYGTEETKLDEDSTSTTDGRPAHPHSYLLADLDVPSATEVRAIKTLTEDEDEFGKVMVPSKDALKMTDLFFNANGIFTTRAANFASKRLFLITDNDDPHQGDKEEKERAALDAKDLHELGVDIELFPVTKPGQSFDRTKFYDNIIWSAHPSDPDAPAPLTKPAGTSQGGEGITLLKSLLSSILSKAAPMRAQFSNLPMEFGPELTISVKGFIIFKRQSKSKHTNVFVQGDRPYLAKPMSTKVAEDSGETVEKPQVRKAYKFGGTQIPISQDDLASIRNFGDPVIRIVGFKPIDEEMLPIWANWKHPTFLYPTELGYVGSTRVFAALHAKLKKSGQFAVAWFIARRNAIPTMAAILPGDEKLNDAGDPVVPGGLWLIPLPFADDIRAHPGTLQVRAPEKLIDHMCDIVDALRLPKNQYSPEHYPNPDLQNHYRMLQIEALGEEIGDGLQVDDKTLPRYKGIRRRSNDMVLKWRAELEKQYRHWREENRHEALAKRPAPSAADDGSNKRAKASSGSVGDAEMRERFDNDTIEKLTMPVLREFLSEKGMKTSGNKADLVERVEKFFQG